MTGVYTPKPHSGMNPNRGVAGFTMNWMARMAEGKTRVEIHLSTHPSDEPSDEPWDSWELTGEPADVFGRVKRHMEFRRDQKTLVPGRYCISVPGRDLKHSFEVA